MSELKVGVIGLGIQGETQVKAFKSIPNVKVLAVCDSNEERLKLVKEKYNIQKAYTNYLDLVNDKEVNVVSVCTPDFMHYEFVMAALRAGKHTIVEKPMATSSKEAEDMVNESKKRGVYLMVNFSNRWSPAFRIAKDSIEKGDIGEILHAYSRLNDTIYVPTSMIKWASKTNTLWFLGSHVIDLLLWYFNDEVKEVYGKKVSKLLIRKGINTADAYFAMLQFKNGGVALLENSWVLPLGEPFIVDFKMDLIGEKGAIKIDRSHHGMIKKITNERYEMPDVLRNIDEDTITFVKDGLKALVDAVQSGKTPPVTGEDGLRVTRIVESIIKSSEKGIPIRI
ncbi:MAG: Gfo/Idh/MocA family protein [Thermoproteota archaeon]